MFLADMFEGTGRMTNMILSGPDVAVLERGFAEGVPVDRKILKRIESGKKSYGDDPDAWPLEADVTFEINEENVTWLFAGFIAAKEAYVIEGAGYNPGGLVVAQTERAQLIADNAIRVLGSAALTIGLSLESLPMTVNEQ